MSQPGWREWAADAGYAAGWSLVRALPERTASGLFRRGADLAVRRGGKSIEQYRANLARVLPEAGPAELDQWVRRGLRSYARYWNEAFRLPAMNLAEVYRRVDAVMTGSEHVDAALEQGRGVVIALPHIGNWDVSGVWLVGHFGRFTTVAERLRPDSLYQRFVAYRESLGFEIVPHAGGAAPPSAILAERLRANRVVCLLADRDLTPAGVPVTFFGEQTRMPAGAAYLASTTGAALLPAAQWFTEDGWGLRIGAEVPVPAGPGGVAAATQALADSFAGDIAAHPADWHMLQKLWLSDLAPARAPAGQPGPPR